MALDLVYCVAVNISDGKMADLTSEVPDLGTVMDCLLFFPLMKPHASDTRQVAVFCNDGSIVSVSSSYRIGIKDAGSHLLSLLLLLHNWKMLDWSWL